MTPSDKLREIADRHLRSELNTERLTPLQWEGIMRTIENVISENYVEKAKYDEAVRQRDELKAIIDRLIVWNKDYPANRIYSTDEAKLLENALTDIVEAAIKSTER